MKKYWISFSANKNLGIVIAEADSVEEAIAQCTMKGCNPGGEALGHEIPDNLSKRTDVPENVKEWFRTVEPYKLMQVKNLPSFLCAEKLSAEESRELAHAGRATVVCECCNTGLKAGEKHIHDVN